MSWKIIDVIPDAAETFGCGLLGATGHDQRTLGEARLEMIERRILRIEMVLRRAGLEVEGLKLP